MRFVWETPEEINMALAQRSLIVYNVMPSIKNEEDFQ